MSRERDKRENPLFTLNAFNASASQGGRLQTSARPIRKPVRSPLSINRNIRGLRPVTLATAADGLGSARGGPQVGRKKTLTFRGNSRCTATPVYGQGSQASTTAPRRSSMWFWARQIGFPRNVNLQSRKISCAAGLQNGVLGH